MSWVRAMLHVAHRVENISGHHVPLSLAMSHWCYSLSSPYRYQGALGQEPEALAHMPLAEICKQPAPKDFLGIWQNDVLEWLRIRAEIDRLKKQVEVAA